MASGNFQALAVKLAAAKGPNVQKATMRSGGGPWTQGHVYTRPGPRYYGRPGQNTGPRSGLVGIGGRPGYGSREPRYGRPRVTGRSAPHYYYPSGSQPRV